MLAGTSFLNVALNFKTQKCPLHHDDDSNLTCCSYYHNATDFRRPHLNLQSQGTELAYLNVLFVSDLMPAAQRALFAQNGTEYNYHVLNYKSKPCPYLAITEACALGANCPYLHPGDSVEEVAKLRERLLPALNAFLANLEFCAGTVLPSQIPASALLSGFFHDMANGKDGRRRARHEFIFGDGEVGYIHGSQVEIHEDIEHEFKNWTLTKNFEWLMNSLQEYICAFSNTSGGTIYIGISDGGYIVGTGCDRLLMDRICLCVDQIRMSFKPMLNQPSQVTVEFKKVVQVAGKRHNTVPDTYVVELHVKQGSKHETYATYEGKVFIRLSASNRELVGSALIKYVKEKCADKQLC